MSTRPKSFAKVNSKFKMCTSIQLINLIASLFLYTIFHQLCRLITLILSNTSWIIKNTHHRKKLQKLHFWNINSRQLQLIKLYGRLWRMKVKYKPTYQNNLFMLHMSLILEIQLVTLSWSFRLTEARILWFTSVKLTQLIKISHMLADFWELYW